jgi:hypothetical protein
MEDTDGSISSYALTRENPVELQSKFGLECIASATVPRMQSPVLVSFVILIASEP